MSAPSYDTRKSGTVVLGGLLLVGVLVSIEIFGAGASAEGNEIHPSWADDLPIAVLQKDLSPVPEEMERWRIEAEACMASKGYIYDASMVDYALAVDENRYGITQEPSVVDREMPPVGVEGLGPQESASWHEALVGTESMEIELSDGSTLYLSTGGCVETADEAVFVDRVAYFEAVYEIQTALAQSWEAAAGTQRIRSLLDEWSVCMAANGAPFDNLEEAAEATIGDPSVVLAHNGCDQTLSYTQTWVEVESGIQQKMLSSNPIIRNSIADLPHD
ncbi:MAG: hypothetical protein WEF28_12200 [Acidimicrobiia bacterium]